MKSILARCCCGVMVLSVLACGSDSTTPTAPSSPAGPQSTTFTGSASLTATGGCSGPGHAISAGEGSITITATQASGRVSVQVCSPTAQNHATECSVPPFARLGVGESLTATLRGGRAQVITIFPEGCGAPGPSPGATTITYTISATYPG